MNARIRTSPSLNVERLAFTGQTGPSNICLASSPTGEPPGLENQHYTRTAGYNLFGRKPSLQSQPHIASVLFGRKKQVRLAVAVSRRS